VKREVLPPRKAPPVPLLCDPVFLVILFALGGVHVARLVMWAVSL
jgi:hypothetical protein